MAGLPRSGSVGGGFIGEVHARAAPAAGGVLAAVAGRDAQSSEARPPRHGLGEVDWRAVVDTRYEGGFEGVPFAEHEDPVWGGTEDRIEAGLQVTHRTVRPLLVA